MVGMFLNMNKISEKTSENLKPFRGRDKRRTVAILKAAAREQLVSHGVSGTSVQPILERAELSRGALFHHFPTKNHLLAAAYDDLMRFAAARLRALSAELRAGIISREAFAEGLRDIYCSDLFIGSMEIALNQRVEPQMGDLISGSIANWWVELDRFWFETFHLPGVAKEQAAQHWVMAANLLRGHAFTSVYHSSDVIRADFCAAFEEMVLAKAEVIPLTDNFALLEQDLDEMVGLKLFTVLAVRPPHVERIYTNHPTEFPLTGRKRLDASPWGDHVVTNGQAWLGRDAADLEHMFPDHATIARIGCGACINIPVRDEGQTIGSLNILDAPGAYVSEDVAMAQLFARRAMALLSNTQLTN